MICNRLFCLLHSLPGGLKKRATELLNLVYQKCEHYQVMTYGREMLVIQPKVVFEVVPLMFQKVLHTSFSICQWASPAHRNWYTFSGMRGPSVTQLIPLLSSCQYSRTLTKRPGFDLLRETPFTNRYVCVIPAALWMVWEHSVASPFAMAPGQVAQTNWHGHLVLPQG